MTHAQAIDRATHELRRRRLLIPAAAYRLELAQRILELQNKSRKRLGSPYRAASAQATAAAPRFDLAALDELAQFARENRPSAPLPGADNRVDLDGRALTPLKTPDNRVRSPLLVQTLPGRG